MGDWFGEFPIVGLVKPRMLLLLLIMLLKFLLLELLVSNRFLRFWLEIERTALSEKYRSSCSLCRSLPAIQFASLKIDAIGSVASTISSLPSSASKQARTHARNDCTVRPIPFFGPDDSCNLASIGGHRNSELGTDGSIGKIAVDLGDCMQFINQNKTQARWKEQECIIISLLTLI